MRADGELPLGADVPDVGAVAEASPTAIRISGVAFTAIACSDYDRGQRIDEIDDERAERVDRPSPRNENSRSAIASAIASDRRQQIISGCVDGRRARLRS